MGCHYKPSSFAGQTLSSSFGTAYNNGKWGGGLSLAVVCDDTCRVLLIQCALYSENCRQSTYASGFEKKVYTILRRLAYRP